MLSIKPASTSTSLLRRKNQPKCRQTPFASAHFSTRVKKTKQAPSDVPLPSTSQRSNHKPPSTPSLSTSQQTTHLSTPKSTPKSSSPLASEKASLVSTIGNLHASLPSTAQRLDSLAPAKRGRRLKPLPADSAQTAQTNNSTGTKPLAVDTIVYNPDKEELSPTILMDDELRHSLIFLPGASKPHRRDGGIVVDLPSGPLSLELRKQVDLLGSGKIKLLVDQPGQIHVFDLPKHLEDIDVTIDDIEAVVVMKIPSTTHQYADNWGVIRVKNPQTVFTEGKIREMVALKPENFLGTIRLMGNQSFSKENAGTGITVDVNLLGAINPGKEMRTIVEFFQLRNFEPISQLIRTKEDLKALLSQCYTKLPRWLEFSTPYNLGGYTLAFLQYLDSIENPEQRKGEEIRFWTTRLHHLLQSESQKKERLQEAKQNKLNKQISDDYLEQFADALKRLDEMKTSFDEGDSVLAKIHTDKQVELYTRLQTNQQQNQDNFADSLEGSLDQISPDNVDSLDLTDFSEDDPPNKHSKRRSEEQMHDNAVTPDWPGLTRATPLPIPLSFPIHDPSCDKITKSALRFPTTISEFAVDVGLIPINSCPIPSSSLEITGVRSAISEAKLAAAPFGKWNRGSEMKKINAFFAARPGHLKFQPISQYFRDIQQCYNFMAACFGRTPTWSWYLTEYNLGGYSRHFLEYLAALPTPYLRRQAEHKLWTLRLRKHAISRRFGARQDVKLRQTEFDRRVHREKGELLVAKQRTQYVREKIFYLRDQEAKQKGTKM